MDAKRKSIIDEVESQGLEVILLDGFNDAILGLTRLSEGGVVVAYSVSKIIASLMDDLSYEEAREHFEFNIIGSYLGPKTPVYVEDDFLDE